MKKTADMINMVTYPKLILYDACYPGASPEIRAKTSLFGSIQKYFFKALFRSLIQTCRAASVRARSNANTAFFSKRTIPTTDATPPDPKYFGDLERRITGFEKLDGLLASLFKNNRISGWSHIVPPPGNIGL
jgi:hypothetical protein